MSARPRLPSRLGCALGAGLRSLGSSRQWWPTRWSVLSATLRGRLYLPGWAGRRHRSPLCRVRAIGFLRSFGWCWLVTSVLLGYDTAEVDAFLDAIRDKFLGITRPPLAWHAAHGKQFTITRPGYDVQEVDAFLDKAEPRLAAVRATDKGRHD